MTVQSGDFVSWAKSGGTSKGKVVSVHANSTVPHTNPKVHGTPDNPAVKVQVHSKNEDGTWSAGKAFVAVAADQLTKIDPLALAKDTEPMAHALRSRGIDHRMVDVLEIRDASTTDDDGNVTAYQFWARVVTYGNEDTYGTDFLQGVFNDYLTSHPNRPTLLYGHGGSFGGIGAVLGHRTDWREDASGCDILFTFDDFDSVPNAKQAWAQLMSGTFDSFSVGFIRRDSQATEEGGVVHIITADLPEVSIVIEPSVPGTGILAMSGQRSGAADLLGQILMRYSTGEIDLADAMTEMRDAATALAHPDGATGAQGPPAASDDNIKQLAANVDAAVDSLMAELADPTSDDNSQALAIGALAQSAADSLLDALGVDDPDDDDGDRETIRAERRTQMGEDIRAGNPFAKAAADKPKTGKGAPITKGTYVQGPGVKGIGLVTSDPLIGKVSVKNEDGSTADDVPTKPLSVLDPADAKKQIADNKASKKSADEAEARDALALLEY